MDTFIAIFTKHKNLKLDCVERLLNRGDIPYLLTLSITAW